ncbi:MAG: Crp/Fnr family transcriptional regulator [Haliscomenobacter sp.]|nr:Crp/Fnr family transcriptional regulator [Haliscomenobacter sp.]MBK8878824.1 Crp/Fnr family transcriptional regulator [Haliscomenobacter sp.]
METKLSFIRQFPLFSVLSESERELLAQMMVSREIPKYSLIYRAGDVSNEIFLLAKGAVKTGTHSSDGKEVIKSVIHPLAMFGEMGLIGEEERQEFSQALKENLLVYVVKVEDFRKLTSQNVELGSRVMLSFGRRLIRAEQKLESLVFKDARTRIVEFIKDSAQQRGLKVGYETLVKHSLTHQDIANITCTSRQTVTLVLNDLKKSDLIYFNRGKILVRDLARLA